MKKLFLNYSMCNIKKYFSDYSDEKLLEIRYGLEGIYLSFTKLIVISAITILLNLFYEMIIMMIVFNILRATGFGIHAKKSIDCWISSTLIFIIFPLLSKWIILPLWLHIVISIIFLVMIGIYAPSDTVKHPLINKKKRIILKIVTVISTLILIVISFFTNSLISNLILFGILTEIIVIHPITYKICGLPYGNYKNYGLNSNV